MTTKEIGELRRRFKPDKSAIRRIYGCYVNSQREILADLDEALGMMPQEEAEQYLNFLKKVLSGAPGRNLIDIVFSNQQVMDSDEHRLLMALRDSGLEDTARRQEFYRQVIDSLDMGEDNYLLLLAGEDYDVPRRGKDGQRDDDGSEEVFRYFVCAICPVKDGKVELGYFSGENEFHNCLSKQLVGAPALGFLFPAFDDRRANIYNMLYYVRKPEEPHHELIDGVFHTDLPMTAAEEREAFQAALSDALGEACSMELFQSVHERLAEKIEEYRESRDPEPLTVSPRELGELLVNCGVPEEKTEVFRQRCGEEFGEGAVLRPENLIDSKRFEVRTGDATLHVSPDRSYLVETRIIDGRKYILIPADEGAEINGFSVHIAGAAD